MRIFIVPIFFVLSAISSLAQTKTVNNGFTDTAEAKNQIVNGLKEGKWVEITTIPQPRLYKGLDAGMVKYNDRPDRIYRLIVYHLGIPVGMIKQYKNGILMSDENYVNGKLNGLARTYYPDGAIEEESYYKDSLLNGISIKYYDNISSKQNGTDKDFSHGSLRNEYNYTEGKLNGEKEYYQNGIIEHEGYYTDGSMYLFKTYYPDGRLQSETPYSNGQLNGVKKDYYDNGMLMNEGDYVNGKMIIFKNFDENGN